MSYDLFANTTLTEEGMRSLIRLRGGLPQAYRFTGWKYLLHLPDNSACFLELVRKGAHPFAVASFSARYPLRDRKLFRKTAVLISALAHWSPVWGEAEFVPAWIFPFVVVFQQDDLGAFEAAMSFLLHWGSRLLVTFPQPPVPVLASMELALQRVDPRLASHLKNISVGALSYGWPLLRSAFCQVLCRNDWLRLLDRLLANSERPDLLEAAAVGFVVASRATLLNCRSTGEADMFFRQLPAADCAGGAGAGGAGSNAVDVAEMFRVMDRVARLGRPEEWNSNGGDDETAAALRLLRSAPKQFQPLPRGRYPVFDGYPQFVTNYQAELRERVARQERDVNQKRQIVQELEERARSISSWESDMESAEDDRIFITKPAAKHSTV